MAWGEGELNRGLGLLVSEKVQEKQAWYWIEEKKVRGKQVALKETSFERFGSYLLPPPVYL